MFTVIPMKKKHIDAVHQIECESFQTPWSKLSFEREIVGNEHAHYYVAVDRIEDTVIGYGGLWIIVNEAHITNIAVTNAYQRKGVASLILLEMCALSKAKQLIGMTLEVRVNRNSTGKYSS